MAKKRVLFLVNHDVVIYNFRLELVERLLNDGYEVHISSPYGERIDDLKSLGAMYHKIGIERHGMNPINEIKLLHTYKKLMTEVKPDIVFGYTIKPNIYGAMAAGSKNIPFVANITGLGTAVENHGASQKLMITLYKIAFRKIQKVFFQNTENRQFFIDHNIAVDKHGLLPGSGVNIDRFPLLDYPDENGTIKFLFIGRIMKDKGIDELLEAAEAIHKEYSSVEVGIVGWDDGVYQDKIENAVSNKSIIFYGKQRFVNDFIKDAHCIVLPSYHEGMANVLLESASSGRPVIASDIPGCRETFDEGASGFGCVAKNSTDLLDKMKKFVELPYDEKVKMGLCGREKIVKEFNREIVVNEYLKIINSLDKEKGGK